MDTTHPRGAGFASGSAGRATRAATPHTRARAWARAQAISGLLFAAFALLHLANIALAAHSPGAFDAFQRATRGIYQHRLVELPLLLLPLVVHAVCGIARMRGRRATSAPRSRAARAHRYAGYFLLAAIGGHVAATRLPAVLHGASPFFAGIAFSFQLVPGWFHVYYPLLAIAGLLHLSLGVPLALGVLGVRVPAVLRRGPAARALLSLAAAVLLLGIAGLGGLRYPVADQSAHPFARVLSSWLEAVGRWAPW